MALRRERVVERLSELRERAGLSQEDAARRVGVTHRQWQRWESGESMPYPRNLDRVASAFGISVADFFDDQPLALPDPRSDQLDRIERKLDRALALGQQIIGLVAQGALEADLAEQAAQVLRGLGQQQEPPAPDSAAA